MTDFSMKVNEIFYSLQGEGHFTGTAAVFIRFSGCNLKCPFCDTQHESGQEMSQDNILNLIKQWPARHIVITGGEPALQVTDDFISLLHRHGYFVQAETNGTVRLPDSIDWITCSPKTEQIVYDTVDELKIVFNNNIDFIQHHSSIKAKDYRLQPCDTGDQSKNELITADCIEYIKHNPQWSLSLQTHKLLDIQ